MPIPPRPRRPGAHARVTTASLEAMADDVLLAPVAAARNRIQNPRELSERVAFGKALWRELVIGFAAQLGEVRLGFTQLAALYALADGGTTTIADLADTLNRSPSATSRLVDGWHIVACWNDARNPTTGGCARSGSRSADGHSSR